MIATDNRHNEHVRPKAAGRRRERGTALVAALLVTSVLMAVVLVTFHSTDTASKTIANQESNAQSLAAAEYGANRAIMEMSSWFKKSEDNIRQDWVYGESGEYLYVGGSPTNKQALDHRRFAGTFGNQEYRVMVRSATLAKEHGTKGDNWLWKPDAGERLYEIIATARTIDPDPSPEHDGRLTYQMTGSTLQTVVSAKYQNDWDGGLEWPALYASHPANVQFVMDEDESVIVSGEDHNITKYYSEPFETETIVTPLKLASATANFMLADGGYWRAGQLTLNYRMEPDTPEANPHRPKTPDFGTSSDARAMYVADTSREYDTYLLGGKRNSTSSGQGKTVTVDMSKTIGGITGQINETNNSQTSEGGSFNLVLGKFEDLRNLYINMAGVVGAYTNSNEWWQMYVGQYTHSPRNSPNYSNSSLKSYPNYGGTRIRAQTAHLMKNKKGQVLVRLFKHTSNGKLYKYPASSTAWTGQYVWADVGITKGAGVYLTKNATATTTVPGEIPSQQAVARTFFWQELVGYQLLRRFEHRAQYSAELGDVPFLATYVDLYPNEPAIMTQRDVPADTTKQKIDKRTIYRRDVDGTRFPAGFDEIYQSDKLGGVPGNSTSNSKHPLSDSKYNGDVTPGYMQDRFDTIYVYEYNDSKSTYEVVPKSDMNAFLFEKDFGNDDDGNPIIRQALALHIGYEDQRETTADFDYCDMVFTIYIAPSVEMVVDTGTMFTLLTDQWWEQNPDNGLTGQPAHPALITNSDPAADKSGDVYKYNFELLGYTPRADDTTDPVTVGYEDYIFNMKKEGSGTDLLFLRAKFEENIIGALAFKPAVDEDGFEITDQPYYWTEDDLNSYLIHEWKRGGDKELVLQAMEGNIEPAKAQFLASIPTRFEMKEMPSRWDPTDVTKPILAEDEENSSYRIWQTAQSIRRIVADIFGYKYQDVPVVQTYEYNPTNIGGTVAKAVTTSLGYVAGEMIQDPAYADTKLMAMDGDFVDMRDDRMTDQPDGSQSPTLLFLAENPDDAVKMAYHDYYVGKTPDILAEKTEMQAIYGIKDERFSIGFHRSGPEDEYAPRFGQDRYEVVLMGQIGFNPYMETTTADGQCVAKNSEIDPNGPDRAQYNYEFKYAKDGMVPDFTFEDPIDGAGILFINGNLIIKDEFAYYGLLIVTGDIIVRPTYKATRFIYGADGDPVDAYGNSLYKNAVGEWEYIWKDPEDSSNTKPTTLQLDEEGNNRLDADGNPIAVKPLYATGLDAYRGRLITQGNVLVGGRIINETVDTGMYGTIRGQIHCYASQRANDLTQELAQVEKDVIEVMSWTSNNNAGFEEDTTKLWLGKD